MSNRIFRMSAAIGSAGRCLRGKVLLLLALGFLALTQPATLKAQDPAPGSEPGPPAATVAAPLAASSTAPLTEGNLICPNDQVDVYVYDVPELSRTYTVSPSGAVIVPLLPRPIQAAGLTPEQFARAMEDAFRQSGRLRRPEIAVSIKQSRNLSVTVDGAVKSPQILPEVGQARLIDILIQCGGLADDAGTTLTITRAPLALRELAMGGAPAALTSTLELKRVLDGTDPASSTPVWPGDRVTVIRAGVFYVLGEVRSPGAYNLRNGREDFTILRALALVGDATSVAKRHKAMIIRNDPKAANGRDEIMLDLKKILAGKSPDLQLEANDILYVPGSNGKRVLRTITGVPASVANEAAAAAVIVH